MKANIQYSAADIKRLIARDILTKFQVKIAPQDVWLGHFTQNNEIQVEASVDIAKNVKESDK